MRGVSPRRESYVRQRDKALVALSGELGVTALSERFGISPSQVYYILHRDGVFTRRCDPTHELRNAGIAVGYTETGLSISQLARKHGISRQRIQQILSAAGIGRERGLWERKQREGAIARRIAATQESIHRRDQKTLKGYGCTYAEAVALNGGSKIRVTGTPAEQFYNVRLYARRQGLDFRLTFPEYMALVEKRPVGRCSGQYGLVVKDRSRPVQLGNVEFVEVRERIAQVRHATRRNAVS